MLTQTLFPLRALLPLASMLLVLSPFCVPLLRAEVPETNSVSDVVLGTAHEFHSSVLDEARTINVLLPPGYDAGSDSYPVVYLLDGAVGEDYHHVSGLVQFLTAYELMPPSILVGIANEDRVRDMTGPTQIEEHQERSPSHGGSTEFRRFLSEELKPYVAARFRTSGKTTLIGQSLAGLFATEVLVEEPELFDDYVIVSPSLWWNDHALVSRFEESLQAHPDKQGTVCIAVGAEGPGMEGPVHRLAAALAARAPEGLGWHHIALPEETHATVLHRALYRAFELLYGETHGGL